MDLLDGVSAVDWTSFKQESGDAPRIPTLFEKLLDAKAAVRSRAAQDLARALVPYDGYVRAYFHVGLEAVPFVARLATAPESPVRALMMVAIDGAGTDRAVARMLAMGAVRAVHSTTGRWDVIVDLATDSLRHLDETLARIRKLDNVSQSETHLLMSTRLATAAR